MIRGRVEFAWFTVSIATAILLGYAIITRPLSLVAMTAGLVVILIIWRPAAVPVGMLVLAQEINPDLLGEAAPMSMVFGHELYFADLKVPPAALLVIASSAAVGASLVRLRAGRLPGSGRAIACLTIAIAVTATAVSMAAGQSLPSALNQDARPFLLLLAGLVIGAGVRCLPAEPNAVRRVASWTLVSLAVLGALTALTGRGARLGGGPYMAFYDSALPAVAGAVGLSILSHPERRSRAMLTVGAASLLIVVVSFRRSIWVGIVVAVAVAAATAPGRGRLVKRLAGLIAVTGSCLLLAPGIRYAAWGRVQEVFLQQDAATLGHVNDLHYGWLYVQKSPLWGVGPRHESLPGLASQSGRLYVHNELLLMWLRYGALGAALTILLLATLAYLAIRKLRDRAPDDVSRAAAFFALILPVASTTAPFMATTSRWPALVGIAAGVLTVVPNSARPPRPGRSLMQANVPPDTRAAELRRPDGHTSAVRNADAKVTNATTLHPTR